MHMPHSVVLVAPDRQVRNRLRDMLEEFGIEVWVVWRSDTALTLLEARSLGGPKRQFSLIVVERDMPHSHAAIFIDEVRAMPALSSIPILVVASKISPFDQVMVHRFRNCRIALKSGSSDSFRSHINQLSFQV